MLLEILGVCLNSQILQVLMGPDLLVQRVQSDYDCED